MREIITLEKRILDYLLEYCDMTLEDAEEYYERIDNIIPKLKIGDKLYKYKKYDLNTKTTTYYELTLIKIIDIEEGIVLVEGLHPNEFSINKYLRREEKIKYLRTEDEISSSHIIEK